MPAALNFAPVSSAPVMSSASARTCMEFEPVLPGLRLARRNPQSDVGFRRVGQAPAPEDQLRHRAIAGAPHTRAGLAVFERELVIAGGRSVAFERRKDSFLRAEFPKVRDFGPVDFRDTAEIARRA